MDGRTDGQTDGQFHMGKGGSLDDGYEYSTDRPHASRGGAFGAGGNWCVTDCKVFSGIRERAKLHHVLLEEDPLPVQPGRSVHSGQRGSIRPAAKLEGAGGELEPQQRPSGAEGPGFMLRYRGYGTAATDADGTTTEQVDPREQQEEDDVISDGHTHNGVTLRRPNALELQKVTDGEEGERDGEMDSTSAGEEDFKTSDEGFMGMTPLLQAHHAMEKMEEFVHKVWEGRWRVIPHDVLPEWLKDNEYLRHGHRPPMPSFRACFKSIFRIHTETGNIWTHLLGKRVVRAGGGDTITNTHQASI
ncbi:uncharacterized protein LOC129838735 [Salvelinus fontinalis]|uniref:uncharacterized protein LOC129838735 n=1 Tax=Salvelinus fontinalis TaxID=8038 RepID=UPI00248676A2|nr:uncharacterized protein LOC129838735 [Salvelinus fontinalis]